MHFKTQVSRTKRFIHQTVTGKLGSQRRITECLAYTAILKLRVEFSAELFTSDYGFLFRLVNNFIVNTEEYYPSLYKVNDARP